MSGQEERSRRYEQAIRSVGARSRAATAALIDAVMAAVHRGDAGRVARRGRAEGQPAMSPGTGQEGVRPRMSLPTAALLGTWQDPEPHTDAESPNRTPNPNGEPAMKTNPWGPKPDSPETMRQAQTWQNVNNRYIDLGLCFPCAAQAAYGHQLGFSRIHPPCEACKPIVATFPHPAVGPWRKTLSPSGERANAALKAKDAGRP